MKKPIIFTIDDDPQVLNAIEYDLINNYSEKYKIVKSNSAKNSLIAIEKFKKKNFQIALFLVDQRMPEITGIEFLEEASKMFPETKKVLLTAYADTEIAIKSINELNLDYYLLKPWDPPDEKLYPVIDDLLDDWFETFRPIYDGIKIYGTLLSPKSHEVKEFLSRNQIPYRWYDIETDLSARAIAESENKKLNKLPLIVFPDGKSLLDPSNKELANKIGIQTKAKLPFYDLVIIGGGPAGLGASVYGSSEGLKTLLIEKKATGGQAGTSSFIENYLGFPKGISGADLSRRALTQAKRFGSEIVLPQEVVSIKNEYPYKYVTLEDGSIVSTKALLISTGVTATKLDKPGISKFTGKGIYYGAASAEALNFKDKNIIVVGGANSAGQGAMYLSKFAKKVSIIIRGDSIEKGMSQYLVDKLLTLKNVEIISNSEISKAKGEKKLEQVEIFNNKSQTTKELNASAMFVFIGAFPHSQLVNGLVELDEKNFIITGLELLSNGKPPKNWPLERQPFYLETSIPGIFAAGDVRHGSLPRISAAIGQGAIAINLVHQYLKTV